MRPFPAQMWVGVRPVPAQMWAGVSLVPVQMWPLEQPQRTCGCGSEWSMYGSASVHLAETNLKTMFNVQLIAEVRRAKGEVRNAQRA